MSKAVELETSGSSRERPSSPLISVVLPSYNEEANIPAMYAALCETLAGRRFELIFVDDGSADGTLDVLKSLAANNANCGYISFSRNFGHQLALRAGLEAAQGDCVVSMDADMQHPPALILTMLEKWQSGADIVLTRRNDSRSNSLFKRWTSRLYYSILRKTFGVSILPGGADFRLMDRRAVDALNEFRDPLPFYRGLVSLVGFRQEVLDYKPGERLHGQSKYALGKMIALARAGIVNTTVQPLRFTFLFSGIFFLFFLGYTAFIVYTAVFGENIVPGWASVALLISLVGFFQALSLAILSEYIAQISMSTRGRPSYIVQEAALCDTNHTSSPEEC